MIMSFYFNKVLFTILLPFLRKVVVMFKPIMCLMFLAMFCLCYSQSKLKTESDSLTLCWEGGTKDTAASYVVYYRDYIEREDTTTEWNFVAKTKSPSYTVTKGKKKTIIFGVATILYDDTSEIHSSFDTTACTDINVNCGSNCVEKGPWYLRWFVKKPTSIKVGKK